MSNAISLRVPKTLYQEARAQAEKEGISLNQYVMLAVAEKVAREQALDYLQARLHKHFDNLLFAPDSWYADSPE